MIQQFTIKGRLPGLNELLKGHWAVRNKTKSEAMRGAQIDAMQAKIRPIKKPCKLTISCYEPNRKRDRDNVTAGACKIIQDALVQIRILPNDTPAWIVENTYRLDYDRDKPRIEVVLEEVE